MIIHFLKWDMRTFRFQWILLAALTALFLPFLQKDQMLQILFFVYFIFACVPTQQISGVKFRSQHIMSRSYLLALPMDRKQNFLFVLARQYMFMLPMLALFIFIPFLRKGDFEFRVISWQANWEIAVLVPLVLLWLSCESIEMQVAWERITSYLTSAQRFRAWVFLIFCYCTETAVILAALVSASHVMQSYRTWACFRWFAIPLTCCMCIFRFYNTRRKWVEF